MVVLRLGICCAENISFGILDIVEIMYRFYSNFIVLEYIFQQTSSIYCENFIGHLFIPFYECFHLLSRKE